MDSITFLFEVYVPFLYDMLDYIGNTADEMTFGGNLTDL